MFAMRGGRSIPFLRVLPAYLEQARNQGLELITHLGFEAANTR